LEMPTDAPVSRLCEASFRISRLLPPTTKPAKASNPPHLFFMHRLTGRLRTGAAAGMTICYVNRGVAQAASLRYVSDDRHPTTLRRTEQAAPRPHECT